MRIAVIGAGAIGSVVAAGLADAGRDVVLVARGRRLAALQAGPLRIESSGVTRECPVRAVAAEALEPPIDFAVCCVKTPDLETALAALRPALAPHAMVLTLQNGIEAHERAAQLLPDATILAGRMHGFYDMAGDLVRHVGVEASILMGTTHGDPDRAAHVVATFAGSGIRVSQSADIVLALWEKFLLAASLGTVAAALDIPAGAVLSNPQGAKLLPHAMAEIVALAGQSGVGLTHRHIRQTLDFVSQFPPDATTSLQRDLEAGRKSEFDALTGAVARLAERSGLSLTTFPALIDAIAARSEHNLRDHSQSISV